MTDKHIGMLWFLAQCITVPITVCFVRLAAEGATVPVLIFIQNCISLALMTIYMLIKGISFKTKKLKLHAIRNVFGLGSWTCFFYAITLMPLNSVTAITFTAPIIASLMAAVALKEKIHKHRAEGLVIGFIGMLVLLHPGSEILSPIGFVAFFGVITISITQILMNVLNRTEGSVQMVFYMTFFSTLMTVPFAFFMWHTPSAESLVWITLIAIFAIFNVYALVRAIKMAGISAMMPLDFTRLIITAILAYFVFAEVPDKLTTLGAIIIIIGAIYVVKKERHAQRMADSK